jgi:hypothetical protein
LFEAYNAHDLDGCMACLAPEITIENSAGEPLQRGRDEVRAYLERQFADRPGPRAHLLDRISVGAFVIDEALVDGLAGVGQVHIIVMYRVGEAGTVTGMRILP